MFYFFSSVSLPVAHIYSVEIVFFFLYCFYVSEVVHFSQCWNLLFIFYFLSSFPYQWYTFLQCGDLV